MKYLVKSVDMMSPRTVINAKNSPVPIHREGGRTRPILALVAAMRMRRPAPRKWGLNVKYKRRLFKTKKKC